MVISASLQACGVVFPFAMLTSICRSIVTICSGLYLFIGMTASPPNGFSLIPLGTKTAGHVNRLSAAGVVGHRQHDQRDALAPHTLDQVFERHDIHVALEGMLQARLASFRDHQVSSLGTDEFHVGAGGIEMRVVGDDIAFLAHHAEQNALGGATLMSGNDVFVAKDILHRIAKAIEAAAAGVALVAFHDCGPQTRGHGAGSGIGEEIDENVIGGKKKQVVKRSPQPLLALRAGGPVNRLDALDAKRLDNGAGHGGSHPTLNIEWIKTAQAADLSSQMLRLLRLRWCALDHRSWGWCSHRSRREGLDRNRFHHIMQVIADDNAPLPEARNQKEEQDQLAHDNRSDNVVRRYRLHPHPESCHQYDRRYDRSHEITS